MYGGQFWGKGERGGDEREGGEREEGEREKGPHTTADVISGVVPQVGSLVVGDKVVDELLGSVGNLEAGRIQDVFDAPVEQEFDVVCIGVLFLSVGSAED